MWRGRTKEVSTYSDPAMFWSLMENSVVELLMLWMSITHSVLTLVSPSSSFSQDLVDRSVGGCRAQNEPEHGGLPTY